MSADRQPRGHPDYTLNCEGPQGRTVQIKLGQHTITAEDPLPADLRDAFAQIN